MKTMMFAAITALTLGMGAAYAQGLPPGTSPPVYGAHAFAKQPFQNSSVFSRLFGHSESGQAAADRTAARTTAAVKGG